MPYSTQIERFIVSITPTYPDLWEVFMSSFFLIVTSLMAYNLGLKCYTCFVPEKWQDLVSKTLDRNIPSMDILRKRRSSQVDKINNRLVHSFWYIGPCFIFSFALAFIPVGFQARLNTIWVSWPFFAAVVAFHTIAISCVPNMLRIVFLTILIICRLSIDERHNGPGILGKWIDRIVILTKIFNEVSNCSPKIIRPSPAHAPQKQ